MKSLYFLLMLLLPILSVAQKNTKLRAQLDYPQFVNDIWGWVAEDGTEYAIVGTQTGTSIVSLAEPTNPVEVAFVEGPNSTWRDIKTWGNFAYVTHDSARDPNIGLHIIDLSQLPDTVIATNWMPELDNLGTLGRCHNLYIDEFGLCYLAGCDVNNGGMIFVDVASEPGKPQFIGTGDARYAHDVYVKNNLMFASEVYAGNLSITDVSDKGSPVLLATQSTPFTFTHNAWATDDNQTIFTTDERGDASVAAYDISNLEDIQLLDEFRPSATIGRGVIPHNVHVLNDYLIISYYTDGILIVDASVPEALVEVGNFDTYEGADGGFSGAWGAYPFLPSGLILASDRQNGLFVIEPQYQRGSFLKGVVKDAITLEPIPFARIEVSVGAVDSSFTDNEGIFTLGYADEGTYRLTFSTGAAEYEPKVIMTTLQSGETELLEVLLVRKDDTTTSTDFTEEIKDFQVYPNPFSNRLSVDINQNIDFELTVRDILGRKMFSSSQPVYELVTTNWATGIYLLEVYIDGKIATTKKVMKGL